MLLHRPARSDYYTLAAYWLLAIPVIGTGYVAQYGWARTVPAMAFTVALDTATVLTLVYFMLPNLLDSRYQRRALLLVPVFLITSGIAYQIGYAAVLDGRVYFTATWLLGGIMRHAMSYGLLAVVLSVKRYFELQQRLVLAQKAQAESELRNLKAQLDPHFLFNNLNVLRGLIQHDPAEANEFLTRFAGLYRFLIRHQNDDCVTLADELQFAAEYVYLLRHRFGAAYEFRQQLPPTADLARLLVVPGTVQLLIENVVKHNAGDEDTPLVVTVRATATHLIVSHARRPKRSAVESTGLGLANLRERYKLLFNREIRVEDDGQIFAVTVPVLPQTAAPASASAANRPVISIRPTSA